MTKSIDDANILMISVAWNLNSRGKSGKRQWFLIDGISRYLLSSVSY
jgi:hypothetical protein